jgi:subtilisin family serine protease
VKPSAPGGDATIQAVEWNINKIKAPQVWSTYNVRGDGIVVANIDSGVQFDHPTLVRQYRGRLANGTFNHNYSWFDPSNVCANPSTVPCDNNGHGTHTMGTIVGDDGVGNQIGVAPAARWIAAKGCEESSCSDEALLASGQWMLAPTDVTGRNPRADLRPHIVNNSWGDSAGSNTFYATTVNAWIASGIFPVFSNGNSGPLCQTAGSPGDYTESYAVGAFDQFDTIADFSSRGASRLNGGMKPNISAPGVSVRSAVPDNDFSSFDGTSMAAPHVAGAIALLWSASSPLIGNINGTRTLLDQTAIDVNDTTCGGTSANNNVWGQGKLDIYAAVTRSTRDTKGTLAGTVTAQGSGAGILGATITAVGPAPQQDNFMTTTTATGAYTMRLPAGTYTLTVSGYGYTTQTITGVAVTSGATTTRNIALVSVPRYTVSGTVRNTFGEPLGGVTVSLNAPIPAVTTAANGTYTLTGVPQGSYVLHAQPSRCNEPKSQNITVNAATTANLVLPQPMDTFGYGCQVAPFAFVPGATKLALTGDEAVKEVTLPFPVRFYGASYTKAYVSTNGFLNFTNAQTSSWNGTIPDEWEPHAAIYPFWDDLEVDGSAGVYTGVTGTAPNRQFIIEWRNVKFFGDWSDPLKRVTFETLLHENGTITFQYKDIAADTQEQGDGATVGIENADSTVGFQYASNEAVVRNNFALRFRPLLTNLLQNPGFELDTNFDSAPDSWTRNSNFWQGWSEVRSGDAAGWHTSSANANYTVLQTVGGIVAGQRYTFVGAVNIPPTSDAFTFKLQVQWRNAANAVISTQLVKTYTGATSGWDEAASTALVAPTGAVKAQVHMNVSSLNGDIYVDHFIFGK